MMFAKTFAVAARPSRPAFAAALALLAAASWGAGMLWRAWIVGVSGSICSAHGSGLLSAHCALCYAAEVTAAAAVVAALAQRWGSRPN